MNNTYVNKNSRADYEFANWLSTLLDEMPDDESFMDMVKFIYGKGQ